jgi:hypothetical protein
VAKHDSIVAWLAIITFTCSGREPVLQYIAADVFFNQLVVIFATRTWAIWERSRPILVFLVGLFVVRECSGLSHELYLADPGAWRLVYH